MFRVFITILLVILFLVQCFTRTFIYLDYQVNKNYISNVLCENKAKKEMHCEGKCHLKKELQKEDKKESTPSGSSKEKFETNLFNTEYHQELILFSQKEASTFFHPEENTNKVSFPVFHPPAFTA